MLVFQNRIEFAKILAEIHLKCFEKSWSESEIETLLKLGTTRLWVEKQGFLLCSEVAGEMEILTIGVLPEFRKQGIGLAFMHDMIDYAKEQGIERIFLEVAEDNKAAQALYYKAGFQQIGRREQYYQRTQGAVDALCLGLHVQKG